MYDKRVLFQDAPVHTRGGSLFNRRNKKRAHRTKSMVADMKTMANRHRHQGKNRNQGKSGKSKIAKLKNNITLVQNRALGSSSSELASLKEKDGDTEVPRISR